MDPKRRKENREVMPSNEGTVLRPNPSQFLQPHFDIPRLILPREGSQERSQLSMYLSLHMWHHITMLVGELSGGYISLFYHGLSDLIV